MPVTSLSRHPMNQFPPFPPYATYQPAQELPASTGAPYRLVRDIRPGYRDINMRVIIIDKYVTEGHRPVTLFWLGDQSGSIVCTITGRAAFENHKKGDMLDITNCEARLQRGRMEIFFGKASRLIRYSEDLQAFIPQPNMSHYLWKNEAGGGWNQAEPEVKPKIWYQVPEFQAPTGGVGPMKPPPAPENGRAEKRIRSH